MEIHMLHNIETGATDRASVANVHFWAEFSIFTRDLFYSHAQDSRTDFAM